VDFGEDAEEEEDAVNELYQKRNVAKNTMMQSKGRTMGHTRGLAGNTGIASLQE
jgi:hypothetical protein